MKTKKREMVITLTWYLLSFVLLERSATEYDIITTVLNGYNRLVRPIDPVNNVTHSLIPKETIVFVSIYSTL